MDLLRGNIKTLYFKYLSAALTWIGLILFERPLLMFSARMRHCSPSRSGT